MTNIQGLIGEHLPDLKLFENDTSVQTWVNLQLQADLDKLGVGLTTNGTTSVTPEPSTNSTASGAGTTPQGKNTQLLCVKRYSTRNLIFV